MPGLKGFSAENIKLMRRFYESWNNLEPNSVVLTTELQNNDSEEKSIRRLSLTNDENFPITAFLNISFTHHIAIIRNVKTLEERKYDYYCPVKLTSSFFWTTIYMLTRREV